MLSAFSQCLWMKQTTFQWFGMFPFSWNIQYRKYSSTDFKHIYLKKTAFIKNSNYRKNKCKCNNEIMTLIMYRAVFFLIHHFSWLDTALSFVFINWCYSNSLHWLFHFPIAIRTKWHHKWKKRGGQFKWNNQGDWFPVITSQTTGNGLCMEKCKMAHKWRRDFQS